MKQSILMEFPVVEYEKRLAKILKEMEKDNLDAMILSSDENTYYFSGYESTAWNSKVFTPAVLVITKSGDMSISVMKDGLKTAEAISCVEDFRIYGQDGQYEKCSEAVMSLLKEKKINNGRIGLELGQGHKMHLNYAEKKDLIEELETAEIVDVGQTIWNVRCKKSNLEIERLRKACHINAISIEKCLKEVVEGTTELELYRNILKNFFEMGADFTRRLGIRAGENRYSQSNSPASERKIQRGEIILVDGGPIYKGYHSDIIRQAVIGKPTDYQWDMFEVAREACYLGIENMIPGRPIKEACEAVDKFIQNSKFSHIKVYNGWCGHSLGVGVHEFPMLETRTDAIFEPGMVFAIEPYLFKADCGSLGIEENVLITETGTELLSPTNSELMIL